MLANAHILFLQEHWLSEAQLGLWVLIIITLFTQAFPGLIVQMFLLAGHSVDVLFYGDRMCWPPSLYFLLEVGEFALSACVVTVYSFYL